MAKLLVDWADNLNFLTFYHSQELIHLPYSSIIYLKAEESYTKLFCHSNRNYLIRKNLNTLDELLTPHNFIRIHKSYMINGMYSYKIIKNGTLLETINGELLPIARRRKKEVTQKANNYLLNMRNAYGKIAHLSNHKYHRFHRYTHPVPCTRSAASRR